MRARTAVAEVIPPASLEQLRPGGWLVLPIGLAAEQRLTAIKGCGRAPHAAGTDPGAVHPR
jgi:protein-L-isoaspartate O-methyltransferase